MKRILQAGLREGKKSDVKRGKIGAVLYTNSKRILITAHNAALYGNKDRTIHAESRLILRAIKMKIFERFRNERLNVLVTRWRKSDNSARNAMPCYACHELLHKFPVDIYFTNINGDITWLP